MHTTCLLHIIPLSAVIVSRDSVSEYDTHIHKHTQNKFVFLSDCVQRRADPIPNAMVGGERGDTLEGVSTSY